MSNTDAIAAAVVIATAALCGDVAGTAGLMLCVTQQQ